jgi:hypothetical protein
MNDGRSRKKHKEFEGGMGRVRAKKRERDCERERSIRQSEKD